MVGQSTESVRWIHVNELSDIPAEPLAFLKLLGQASILQLAGKDRSRVRAICTLLHGNEPSGFHAVHHYLKSGRTPKCDVLFFIGNVTAALAEPAFSTRHLNDQRDLNRCFRAPFNDPQGLIAHRFLEVIHALKPECLIDIHNTSGSGPAFGVAITDDPDHRSLVSLFTNDMIVTDLRLGALMEISEADVPTVTVECGGTRDPASNLIAREGIQRYLETGQVLASPESGKQPQVNCFHNPIRLELRKGHSVAYCDTPVAEAAITLPPDAERFNYGMLTKDEPIGFLGPEEMRSLTARDHLGEERLDEYFEARGGQLFAREPLKLFMVTTHPGIAASDCLFYFVGY